MLALTTPRQAGHSVRHNGGESVDTDRDGSGNSADTDDDNIPDTQDAYPLQHDGALSGLLSREIKAAPALAAVLGPVPAALLTLRL
ncbi:MAG TPA: hypothetical protein VFE15_16560 [Marmoricola sp.]|nr:hypothetical protein [Marmoricola sp.]